MKYNLILLALIFCISTLIGSQKGRSESAPTTPRVRKLSNPPQAFDPYKVLTFGNFNRSNRPSAETLLKLNSTKLLSANIIEALANQIKRVQTTYSEQFDHYQLNVMQSVLVHAALELHKKSNLNIPTDLELQNEELKKELKQLLQNSK